MSGTSAMPRPISTPSTTLSLSDDDAVEEDPLDRWRRIQETGEDTSVGEITVKGWDPDTPYLKALKKAKNKVLVDVYYMQRKEYASSPSFYLDCAGFFYKKGLKEMALQVLSNITELELESAVRWALPPARGASVRAEHDPIPGPPAEGLGVAGGDLQHGVGELGRADRWRRLAFGYVGDVVADVDDPTAP